MKKYIKPSLKVIKLESTDIIQTSGLLDSGTTTNPGEVIIPSPSTGPNTKAFSIEDLYR